jgi:hypothetical protein
MITEPLMDVLIDVVLFLEMSDRSTIDPDAAIKVIETIAAHVQRFGPTDRALVTEYVRTQAGKEPQANRATLMMRIPEMLGIA